MRAMWVQWDTWAFPFALTSCLSLFLQNGMLMLWYCPANTVHFPYRCTACMSGRMAVSNREDLQEACNTTGCSKSSGFQ